MAEKTKAQLIVEVRELKKQREELRSQLEQHISESTEKDGEIAELTENLRTANQKAGNLESENAELSAYKQEALAAIERLNKNVEFITFANEQKTKSIEDLQKELKKERQISSSYLDDLGHQRMCMYRLITGSVWNFIRERSKYRKESKDDAE